MNSWTLPGQSSIKARVLHFQDRIEYSWTRGEISKQWPVTIEIHPTNRCNLRCEFCSYNEIRSDGKMLPNDVFERLITSLIECYPTLTSVVFSGGGEPSTHPYLPTAINRLSKAGIDVGIITNGVHMNDDLFESYCRSTWVRFSLDVPSEDVYVKLMSRHKPDNFKKVLKKHTKTFRCKR